MITIAVDEAKTDLAQLLDAVVKGETMTITRRGVPIATLSPATSQRSAADIDDMLRQWQEARKGITLDGLSHRQLIEEGRA